MMKIVILYNNIQRPHIFLETCEIQRYSSILVVKHRIKKVPKTELQINPNVLVLSEISQKKKYNTRICH